MASSLTSFVDNLAGGNRKIKCKYGHNNKKCETFGIKQKDCECCLEDKNVKDDLIVYKCLSCNWIYQKMFDENLKKQCLNTHKFSKP